MSHLSTLQLATWLENLANDNFIYLSQYIQMKQA